MLKISYLRSREINSATNEKIMYKVKYNRNEYREEYLRSEEWKNLRNLVLNVNCNCQCCDLVKATDVHHLVYRNLVDVTINDLLPVCRDCHNLIHQAIKDEYISQDPKLFNQIKRRTLNIKKNKRYEIWHKWIISKHYLTESQLKIIENLQPFVIKRISGLIKKNVWYDNIREVKFTGKQLLNIRRLIKTAIYRKKHKLDTIKKKGITIASNNKNYGYGRFRPRG